VTTKEMMRGRSRQQQLSIQRVLACRVGRKEYDECGQEDLGEDEDGGVGDGEGGGGGGGGGFWGGVNFNSLVTPLVGFL